MKNSSSLKALNNKRRTWKRNGTRLDRGGSC